jgi:hypothetical protein
MDRLKVIGIGIPSGAIISAGNGKLIGYTGIRGGISVQSWILKNAH